MRRKRTELVTEPMEPRTATVNDVEYVLASIIRSFDRVISPFEELVLKVNNVLRGLSYVEVPSEMVEAALASLSSKKLIFTKFSRTSTQELYGPTWRLRWHGRSLLAKLFGFKKALGWRGINFS